MTVRRSSTSLLVLVSLVAMPLAGCTGGCSEDSTQDVVELWMPDSWVTSGVRAELELCQSGRCSSTQAPVTSEEVEVAFSDFGPRPFAFGIPHPTLSRVESSIRPGGHLRQKR